MGRTLGITEARDQLMKLSDEMTGTAEAVTITKHGKPVMAVLSYDLYESLLETLSILSDREAAEALWRSLADISEGRVQDVEDVLAEWRALP
jgi:antitoxin YefM